MCGIAVKLCKNEPSQDEVCSVQEATKRLHHRGPDQSNVVVCNKGVFGHTRLTIQGSTTTPQPFDLDSCVLCCNAEIYNAKELTTTEDIQQYSDCVSIIRMLRNRMMCKGESTPLTALDISLVLSKFRAIFAFVCYLKSTNQYLIARSICGVLPLYYGFDSNHNFVVCSERKAFPNCHLRIFPPSHFVLMDADLHMSQFNDMSYFYRFEWLLTAVEKHIQHPHLTPLEPRKLKHLLMDALKTRIETVEHGQIAYLLSGGLDSSALVALARQAFPKSTIRTFSIGIVNDQQEITSPDLLAARKVAEHLQTEHTEITVTVEELLTFVPTVVRSVESLDTTTIRASTPMYYLIKQIKSLHKDTKVIISGEGSDECLRGYLSFWEFKSLEESTEWSLKLMRNIHRFDVQRAHQCGAAHSIETRVPFLDTTVLRYIMNSHPTSLVPLCGSEKYMLRKAVEDILPYEIVWRTKEQLSDGVGYSWIDTLRDAKWYKRTHTDEQLCRFCNNQRPQGGEEQLNVFDMFLLGLGETAFEDACSELKTWTPGCGKSVDPSGRVAKHHPDPI